MLLVLSVLFPFSSSAEITKIVIEKREPFADGHEFGVTGAYEKVIGKAYGEVDPKKPHNKGIVNIGKAPMNARGRVEYSMDFFILKPVDMKRGNQTIFYDVVNRGRQALRVNYGAERSNDPSTLAHAGDGFMMRLGYTLVASGWQGDVNAGAGRLTTNFPVAKIPTAALSAVGSRRSLFFRNRVSPFLLALIAGRSMLNPIRRWKKAWHRRVCTGARGRTKCAS